MGKLDIPKWNIKQTARRQTLYIEKNGKHVNDIIITLNNLIEQPRICFNVSIPQLIATRRCNLLLLSG